MRLFLITICCAIFVRCRPQPVNLQRMLYVVPEALPQGYDWRPQSQTVSDIVWTGARLDQQGRLQNAGPALAAIEHFRATPRKFRQSSRQPTPSPKDPAVKHHLLVGLKDAAAGVKILSDAQTRSQSIAGLVAFLLRHGKIAGLQLDFEYVSPTLADAYVAYIRTLRTRLPQRVSLHVAVFAPLGMPAAWRGFHKVNELAAVSDGIIVMLYDLHRPGTAPGCVSGIEWLRENSAELASLPREKVWLGAPLYGYLFGKRVMALSASRFRAFTAKATEADGCLFKETALGSAYFPADSLYAEFERLGKANGFRGVAYWRAGLER